MKQLLKLLAPYFAVMIFWCIWPNAWLAILAYHAQILFWNQPVLREIHRTPNRGDFLFAIPAVLAGPVLYALLPIIAPADLSIWLGTYHLSGSSLVLMIPYFGLVHPVLEQIHWHRLRAAGAWSHLVFAGYHMIVLSSLLTLPWLIICFGVLAGVSFAWKVMERKGRSVTVPVISHILADLGIVVAVWARIQ